MSGTMGIMRLSWLFVILAAAGSARADKKLQDLTPNFERESAGCQVQSNGLARIVTGVAALVKTTTEIAEREELERDAEKVTKGHEQIKEYCDEVTALVTFLRDNANTAYKDVERELDTRDNKVRKLRVSAKKTIEDLAPVTRKLIPLIAKRPTPAKPGEKRVPGKFPSGRTVDLPSLAGSWRLSGTSTSDSAEYTNGKAITASATTRQFTGATCDQQRKSILTKPDAEQLVDLEIAGAAKELGIAWGMRYMRREKTGSHLVSVMCVASKTGGVLATSDVVPAEQTALSDELNKVMLRMIAAQHAPAKP